MRVEVDRGGCIGCGVCAEICPEVFAIADDGLSEVVASPNGFEARVAEAAEACPVSVIAVDI